MEKQTRPSPSPQLASALEQRAGSILDACARVEEGGQSRHPLGNEMALALVEVVRTLQGSTTDRPARVAADVPVTTLVACFAALRRASIAALSGAQPLTNAEMGAIDEAIDAALLRRVETIENAGKAAAELDAQARALHLSILSHDLRGNLNGVVLMLEVIRRDLERTGATAELMEDIGLMRASILEAVETVDRHAYLDKLRRGAVDVALGKVSLSQVVDEALRRPPPEAQERGVRFVNDVSAEAVVQSDAEMISRALGELLRNAAQFASPGEATLWAGRAKLDGQDAWALNVRDQGPGVDEQRLEKLIDPMRRLELKDRGLGLVMVTYIAQQLGGRLEAESTPKGGSTFRLVLPAADEG